MKIYHGKNLKYVRFPVEMDNISTEIEERLLKLENEIPK